MIRFLIVTGSKGKMLASSAYTGAWHSLGMQRCMLIPHADPTYRSHIPTPHTDPTCRPHLYLVLGPSLLGLLAFTEGWGTCSAEQPHGTSDWYTVMNGSEAHMRALRKGVASW